MFAVLYAKVVESLTSEVLYLISDIYGVHYKVFDITCGLCAAGLKPFLGYCDLDPP